MASTSFSSIRKSFKYDVFLSFRGEDTRNSFIGHLYQALKEKGIETYMDDKKIEQGKTIKNQLIKSIEDSRFYIIVFSKTYASSSWCLDELVKIIECQKTAEQTAYPVFFDVEPTQVCKQSGPVKEAFAGHEKNEAAGKWREAMKEASSLAGWELKKIVNGDESKLIQIIVDEIFEKLCSISSSIDGNLIGMEMRKKEVLSSLDVGTNDVRVIGIKGIGGGGKTTLARAVYDQISTHFEGKSFVENVREVSKTSLSGLKTLQEQILRDVFDDRNISISGVSDGKKMMLQMMPRKKVLVVLDDVDHCKQLEALLDNFDNFKSGSRIIITTRDEQVLLSHGVCLICNVKLLTAEEAVCLFSRYAFGKEIPNQGFNEMSGQVGIGGGGKTTLARAVYDQISTYFDGKSFVENVREVSKTPLSGLKTLQEQILRDVFDDRNISISGVSDGKKMMLQMMPRKKVLVVLDDVDHRKQLEALLDNYDNFKSGSRIIITTRDEQVLLSYGVCLICNVKLLTDEEAVCLFSRYAFGKEIPNQGFNEMSGQVVRYAAGLPLTIKVLGSSLRGKSELEWKDALERLKKVPEHETQEILKISYDALENDYKEIFLDVACILKGEQKDKAIRVLESCGFHGRIGLRVLEQKCLINISQSGSLGMHDLIEEMGKNVVLRSNPNEPNRDSRLLIEGKNEDILDNDLVNERIRCIKLSQSELKFDTVMRGLRNTRKLRVLYMCSGANWNDSKVRQCFPDSLQYLSWRSYPFLTLHETFQADNLVLNKLRFLDLSYSNLTTLNLELTLNLEILNLEHCTDLEELYIPNGCPKLQYLNLDFSKLRNLRLGPTPDLETLSLGGCSNLLQLHLHRCPKLKVLKLDGSGLRTLDLGLTPNLEGLDLKGCSNLVDINAPDGCLEKLVYLDLSGCGRFKSFLFNEQSKPLRVDSLSELHLIGCWPFFMDL
nr:disease resistance protein [Tanacetum cinerariifolium]